LHATLLCLSCLLRTASTCLWKKLTYPVLQFVFRPPAKSLLNFIFWLLPPASPPPSPPLLRLYCSPSCS
jgi:hypothetical protein